MPPGKGTVRDSDDEGQGPPQNASGVGYLEITEYASKPNLIGNWKVYRRVGLGANLQNGDSVGFDLGPPENPGNGNGPGKVNMRFARITAVNP